MGDTVSVGGPGGRTTNGGAENDHRGLYARGVRNAEYYINMAPKNSSTKCPACGTGDVISIAMTVSGAELEFSTCHQCEAKWWVKDGQPAQLTSVLGTVGTR